MMMAAVPFLIQSFTKRGSVYGAFCPVQNSSVRGEESVFVGIRRPRTEKGRLWAWGSGSLSPGKARHPAAKEAPGSPSALPLKVWEGRGCGERNLFSSGFGGRTEKGRLWAWGSGGLSPGKARHPAAKEAPGSSSVLPLKVWEGRGRGGGKPFSKGFPPPQEPTKTFRMGMGRGRGSP